MDTLFQKQGEWGTKHGAPPPTSAQALTSCFDKYAMEMGLDINKVSSAIKENRYKEKIERDKKTARASACAGPRHSL